MKPLDLTDVQKRIAKKAFPELEDVNFEDYEVQNFEIHCVNCGKPTLSSAYRINEGEWKGYKKEVVCSDCQVREYMYNSNSSYRGELNKRFTERCWFPPKELDDADFKNYFASNNVTKNALYVCVQYVKNFNLEDPTKNHNLLLMGNPGTGKSHLGFAMAKYLRKKEVGSIGFLTTGKLLSLIKETYKKGASRSENDILNDIEKLDFLVLDDLGAEAGNTDEFSWSKTKMFDIVNSRIGKPTVYTTNYNDKTFAAVVGERVSSRLQTNTKFINMFTEDYRKNLKIV